MERSIRVYLATSLACLGALLSGCGEGGGHVKAVTTQEVETGVGEIFKTAATEARQLATDTVEAIKAKDYTTAWDKLQLLAQQPGLSGAQQEFVAASTAAVGAEVQKAESAGDEAAKQRLEFHRANK